jgi:hypothetical protein
MTSQNPTRVFQVNAQTYRNVQSLTEIIIWLNGYNNLILYKKDYRT